QLLAEQGAAAAARPRPEPPKIHPGPNGSLDVFRQGFRAPNPQDEGSALDKQRRPSVGLRVGPRPSRWLSLKREEDVGQRILARIGGHAQRRLPFDLKSSLAACNRWLPLVPHAGARLRDSPITHLDLDRAGLFRGSPGGGLLLDQGLGRLTNGAARRPPPE